MSRTSVGEDLLAKEGFLSNVECLLAMDATLGPVALGDGVEATASRALAYLVALLVRCTVALLLALGGRFEVDVFLGGLLQVFFGQRHVMVVDLLAIA
mgnify:CR=1 FL=1